MNSYYTSVAMSAGSWEYDPNTCEWFDLKFQAFIDVVLAVEFRRRFSPILAAFPWQWDGIVSRPERLIEYAQVIPQFRVCSL